MANFKFICHIIGNIKLLFVLLCIQCPFGESAQRNDSISSLPVSARSLFGTLTVRDIIGVIESLLPAAPNSTELHKRWFHHTGPFCALQLFQRSLIVVGSSDRNVTSNMPPIEIDKQLNSIQLKNFVFSPLALKLSLIAIASMGGVHDPYNQTTQISNFLFNDTDISMFASEDNDDENDGNDNINLSVSTDFKEELKINNSMNFFRSNEIDFELPTSEPSSITSRYRILRMASTLWTDYMAPLFWWLYGKTRVSISNEHRWHDMPPYYYNLCYRFEIPTSDDCFHLLRISAMRENRATTTTSNLGKSSDENSITTLAPLKAHERLRLCLSFGITDYHECVHRFTADGENYYRTNFVEYSHRDVAQDLISKFHLIQNSNHSIASICNLHRILLLNRTDGKLPATWNSMLRRFAMQHIDLEIEMRNHIFAASMRSPAKNELLNIVKLDSPLRFNYLPIGMHDFHYKNREARNRVLRAEMLRSRDLHRIITTSNYRLLSIPFQNFKRFELIIIVPIGRNSESSRNNSHSDIGLTILGMTAERLHHDLVQLQIVKPKAIITLPRFDIGGQFDFGPLLNGSNITRFILAGSPANNVTMPANLRQFIQVNTNPAKQGSIKNLGAETSSDARTTSMVELDYEFITLDRPFGYMIVGKHIDLHRLPAFEVLLAGIYCGIH